MSPEDLPVHAPEEIAGRPRSRDATVWGVLLAAGTGSRFGDANKLLQPLEGEPIVRHAASSLAESDLEGLTVVVGHEAADVRAAVEGLADAVVENEDYDGGQSTSLRAGIRDVAGRDVDAALVALGDMPRVDSATVDQLVDAYERDAGDVVAPAVDGRRGNPVLFDASLFEDLLAVTGDRGARRLLHEANGAVAVETDDPGVLADVDRPADLSALDGREES